MNLKNNILYNMYQMGIIEDDNMATFTTYDGQYRLELRRENYQLWCTDNSYKYKCFIEIYNNITNNLLVSLNCSEEDIKNILDCYTQMNDFGCKDIMVPALKPYNASGNYYIINLEAYRIYPSGLMSDVSTRWFSVIEYNPLLNQLVPIISIQLYIDEIEELMDIIYFIFLIDLEPESQSEQLLPVPINKIGPSEITRYRR